MDFITNTISSIVSAPFICIGWIVIGIIAGALARRIMGSKNRPLIEDLILGLIGAVIGGFIARLLGWGIPSGGIMLVIVNLVIATIGAVALIAIGRMIRGRR
jgi:uncharacterized membrane protein YeaQ/YmgE (transglycosylase-associated protein family)